jgi:3-hydroxybutyryl-CoA dehydrogenase
MTENIKTIAVIGAGQMGAGIAQVAAASGYQAILWDADAPSLEKGMAGIASQLGKAVEKAKISEAEKSETLGRLKKGGSLKDFDKADLVIEAIVEKFDIKAKVFSELSKIVSKNCIVASNTSSISITRLAAAYKSPESFIGMHFMNPVPVMKLVELIRGLQTSDETYNKIKEVSIKMGKTCVLAIDSPGFIVNRILVPMVNEAIFLLQEGVLVEDIDNAMKLGTNQPMGPLALADFVGLDTLLFILRILHSELGEDKYRPCPLLVKYVEAGWLGKKSGKGFYSY